MHPEHNILPMTVFKFATRGGRGAGKEGGKEGREKRRREREREWREEGRREREIHLYQ